MEGIRAELLKETKGTDIGLRGFQRPVHYKRGYAAAKYNPQANPMRGEKLPIRIRPADGGDVGLIYKAWLKSYHAQNKDQPKLTFYKLHKDVVARLLESSVTLVACNQDDGNDVYAWLCGKRTAKHLVLHYAYTKALFRRFGLQSALLKGFDYKSGEAVLISHKGYIVKDLKKKGYNLLYVPHLQHENGIERVEELYGNPGTTTE